MSGIIRTRYGNSVSPCKSVCDAADVGTLDMAIMEPVYLKHRIEYKTRYDKQKE